MSEQAIYWVGASGKEYKYWIYEIGTSFKNCPGNYIFAREVSPGHWMPIYIGETESLKDRLPNHEKLPCVNRNSGTHVHTHASLPDSDVRKAEEADLLNKWDPACNKE